MPAYTLFPLANSSFDNAWTLAAGASKPAACSVSDDATTYIWTNAGAAIRQGFTHDPLPPATIRINSHGLTCRWQIINRNNFNEQIQFGLLEPPTPTRLLDGAGNYNPGSPATSPWTTTTGVANRRPTTSAAFTSTDMIAVNACELSLWAPISSSSDDVLVTYFAWDFNIEFEGGGFNFIIAQWLGPLVAVGLHEVARLAAHLYRRSGRRVRVLPEEYVRLWREMREARNPSYFFLGLAG